MEHMGAICEGEWSLSGMYSNEEADFMAQLLGNCPIPSEIDGSGNQSTFWPSHGSSSMNMAGVVTQTNSYFNFDLGNSNSSFCFSQGSSYSGGSGSVFFPSSSQESYYLSDSNPIMSMDFCLGDGNNTTSYLIEGEGGDDHCLNGQEMSDGNADHDQDLSGGNYQLLPELGLSVKSLQPKMESEMQQQALEPVLKEEKLNNPSENSKKRSRNTADVQKNKRNVRSKKNQKACVTTNNNIIDQQEDNNNNNNNNNNAGFNRPTSSGCCSEDDSNSSQEPNGGGETESGKAGALNLNGKTRASRGSATDPQSLYARKRRERINERLRILQNLVPNGTKVDISTMLEEAVQYVKFLQLQIKLLSSDDLWMYAPIAYNGMNLGLDLNLMTATTPRLS